MQIDRYLGVNYGSLIKIEYAAVRQISSFTQTQPGAIAAAGIVFFAGYDFTAIYCSEDNMGHHQQQVNDNNGESWTQTVAGFTPGEQDAIEAGLLALAKSRFILRITRPDGSRKIVGSLQEPLELKLDSNTQMTVPGAAGTTLTFSGVTSHRALFYTP